MANEWSGSDTTVLVRNADGRFVKGWKGGPGRPADLVKEKLQFAAQMRYELRRRKIVPERLGDLAAGTGEFSEAPVEAQLKAMALMLAYSYGPPGSVTVGHEQQTDTLIIKRVIGISDVDV
jgi:hypothetical protein